MNVRTISRPLLLAALFATVGAYAADEGSGDAAYTPGAAFTTPKIEDILGMIEQWPDTARYAANAMIEKYGAPQEATGTRLIWFNKEPWKRIVVLKSEINHDFPMPHKDVLEQVINYQVPADKFDDLARYDGSVMIDRTRGEISARCDMEAANFVALNLAHEIVQGKRSVEEARQFYPKAVMAHMQQDDSPYAEKLMFNTKSKTAFTDQPVVGEQMQQQAQKLKQELYVKERELRSQEQ